MYHDDEQDFSSQKSEKKKFRRGFQQLLKRTNSHQKKELRSDDPKEIQEEKEQVIEDDKIHAQKRQLDPKNIISLESDSEEEKITQKRQKVRNPLPDKRQVKATKKVEKEPDKDQPTLKIFVVVRGDITDRIYKTWEIQLPKKLSNYKVLISKEYHGEDDSFVIAAPNCTAPTYTSWLGNQSIGSNVKVLSSEWAIHCIKHGSIPATEDFVIDPMLNQPPESSKEDEDKANQEMHKTSGPFHPSYACISTGEFKTLNPNKYITDILEELQSIYELCGDEWRALGYKKCIGTLKQLPRITHIDQLRGVRGVGDSIREKIQEILSTGKLKKLKYFQDDPKIQAMVELSNIWGVGEKTALRLMKQGYKSIKDLRERGLSVLTFQQKIGLKYYEEFMKKIPRAEIEEILSIVHEHCTRIFSAFECMVCGSYRRGKPQSGDIDILITPSPTAGGDETFRADSIVNLVTSLTEVGLLTDHLTLPEQFLTTILQKELKKVNNKNNPQNNNFSSSYSELSVLDGATRIACRASYMGVCKLNQEGAIHRRIDIKVRNFFFLLILIFDLITYCYDRFIHDPCTHLHCCILLEVIISTG